MRSSRPTSMLLFLFLSCFGCGSGGPAGPAAPADAIDAAQALWRSQHLDSYEVDQEVFCRCAGPRAWTAVVQDGVVASYGYTVEAVFGEIRRARASAASYHVTFDPELGYPTAFDVDWVAGLVDDEWGIRMSNLHP